VVKIIGLVYTFHNSMPKMPTNVYILTDVKRNRNKPSGFPDNSWNVRLTSHHCELHEAWQLRVHPLGQLLQFTDMAAQSQTRMIQQTSMNLHWTCQCSGNRNTAAGLHSTIN